MESNAAFGPLESFLFASLAEAIYDCLQHMSTAPITRMPLLTPEAQLQITWTVTPFLNLHGPLLLQRDFLRRL